MIKHFDRFKGKTLDPLGSHNSCDRSSKETGDIVVRNKDNSIYEVLEIKFDIKPNKLMVQDAYDKFKDQDSVQRYYILSTKHITDEEEQQKVDAFIKEIYDEHGCQIIINGVFDSLKYYLRLLTDSDEFLERYTKNLQDNTELDFEHKIAWNRIINKMSESNDD